MPIYLIYSAIETEMIEICNSLNIDEISFPLTHFKWMKGKIITQKETSFKVLLFRRRLRSRN